VPDAGDDDEAGEEQDLDDETANDNVLAQVHRADRARCHDSTARTLQQEGDHVADDKDLCQPLDSDQGVSLAFCDQDQAAEAHVDAGGEDGGCNQDEDGVD
jgi:hypothetical protein